MITFTEKDLRSPEAVIDDWFYSLFSQSFADTLEFLARW
jgi:hypothetical protein